MADKMIPCSISMTPQHWRILDVIAASGNLGRSATVRYLVELHSDNRFHRDGDSFGLELRPPKWRECEGKND
jgi:hypothetical protein